MKITRSFNAVLFALFAALFVFGVAVVAVPKTAHADCGPVLLDPGHGGDDTGAIGNGLQEKDLTWKITNYCKTRLEQLGIPCVLTRGENENPTLTERCDMIVQYNARALISFHINSAAGTSGTGAEVWVPHEGNYMSFTYDETSHFGNDLLNRFQDLGLLNRGLKTRTIDSSYYPDGSNKDYLAINRLSREKGTSGALIEHAFINNPEDASRLRDDEFLRQLGFADAESIATEWPNSYVKPDEGDWSFGWKHTDAGWWYKNPDGSYPANGWWWIGSAWYHFNEAGYMSTGWVWDDGWYWCGGPDDGAMAKGGWTWCDWAWYWLEDSGHPRGGGWFWDGCWYWLNPGGDMAIGWVWTDGNWYHTNASGCMDVSWFVDGDAWGYADGSGIVAHWGWKMIDGGWYYFNDNCTMHTGWLSDYYWYLMDYDGGWMCKGWSWANDSYYYLDQEGHMQNGWFWDGGNWYWLGASGNMAFKGAAWTDCGLNLFDNSGHWITGYGWYNVDGRYYYLDGWNVLTGWHYIDGSWYFMHDSGEMATGPETIWGEKFFFDKATGKMLFSCWVTADGDWCDASDPARMYLLDTDGRVISMDRTPVMGPSSVDYNTFIANFSDKIRAHYPSIYAEKGAATPEDFAAATWTEAYAEGVNPVVLAAQIGVETGWLKFGGAVPDWACNFGGIGAVDSAPQNYAIFDSVQQGLLAQAQHLKAYASTDPLNEPCVDPRFDLVSRGCAPYVQQFGNGIWATDPNYAAKLITAMISLGA